MESLLNFQTDLSSRIAKARSTFKKSPKERITEYYVESRLEALEQLWNDFRQGHKELLQTADATLLKTLKYTTDDVYELTEEQYMTYKCELKRILIEFKAQSNVSKPNMSVNENVNKRSTLVKLPKISIPTFSGKYTEWPTFRDLFVSMIHNNTDLDNVQKLQYLKGYLTGEAEQLIRHTPVSDANYVQCWKQLEERYSNKKYISNCILKRLLSQRNITTESASCLKDLMDTSSDCLNALQNIGIDVSSWDLIVIHLLSLKLDAESRKQWELNVASNVSSDALPTFKEFQTFLTNRYRALELIEPKNVYKATTFSSKAASNKGHTKVLHATNTVKLSCEFCGEDHKLCFCKKFANQDYEKRHEFVTNNRICYNCLGSNHGVRFCQKATSCRLCQIKHHSLLHPKGVPTGHLGSSVQSVGEGSGERAADGHSNGGSSQSSNETTPVVTCFSKGQVRNQVLLPTAIVNVESKTGQYRPIRALLDQGSQASFVTEATVQGLGLQKTSANLTISGVGGDQRSMRSKAAVTLKLQSLTDPNFKMELKCYVLTKITSLLPERQLSVPDWIELKDLCLADKNFDSPNKIDLLLGAEVYSQILKDGVMKGPAGSPVAQCTALGWILSGPVGAARTEHQISIFHAQVEDNQIIKRFWELENEPLLSTQMLTKEEQRCEDIFSATTRRDEEGRYVVKLPFRDEELTCKNGNSREIAIKRLKSLERKFIKDKVLKERYTEVIKEYMQLGHMVRVPEEEIVKERSVYLPHHAVVREDKTTTKVRVVFDASCKYENGVSLNDNLMVGPTLQPDLRHLIMSWRKHPVCLIADIVKMYRMVKVAEEDCDFQRIVWRDHPENKIQDYQLLTVTFGTASAPYLAVKCLNQVAIDHKKEYPIASEKVAREFYMDDLMTGCQTIEEGTRLYQEMNALLKKGGFILQKWSSNKDELLEIIDQSGNGEHNKQDKALEFKQDNIVKILGLTWNRSRDEFQYSVKLPPLSAPVTKRKIISDVARLFDPLGWIAPCVIKAKIFIQRLWIAGTGWDEEPPTSILEDWYTYRNELAQLTDFNIPRWMFTRTDDVVTELHGFSDASNVAYSAVVYLRVINVNSEVRVVLVSAKTRVSPVRQVSIPRLELCGAALLTKLLVEVAGVLNIPRNDIRAWTDSSVVLAWLNKHPSHWKTFVANRVSEIHSKLESSQWCHVSTKDNPADCASRGVQPSDLAELELWKLGPKFLWNKDIAYQRLKDNDTNEEQSLKVHMATSEIEVSILDRYSSLQRLIRVVAICRRFVTKKEIVKQGQDVKVLKKWELDEALLTCIKLSQTAEFQAEIKEIHTYGQVTSKSSKLLCLTPFIDEKGLLRVNGRITHSQEPRSVKEPIILSHRSHFSDLIVDDAHRKTLHGDAKLMLNFIRSAYWIIGVKNLVKGHVHKCVVCVRHKAKLQNQLMGTLPAVRVTPARAFLNSGVDYAGPIMLRTSKGRGHKAYKGYVSLFVCMVTKAVHIEVVSDLTSRGFLEAFKRFVARRGHCANLYSDNGTNFIGASKELKELFDAEKSTMTKEVAESLAVQGTNWHFIPPRAPNFGGLWEAGIKSVKYHVKRVIGESTLTYEEMSTLLSQIEACLNSRPLSVLSSDPTEAVPLTPGHFLVGEPLVTVPEATYENCNMSTLKRWQITQEMLQSFWRRWSNEYLTHLMHRYKWAFKTPEPEVGNIVLIKEDDLPPTKPSVSTANVQVIFHSVLSELLHDKRRKFTFSEVSYFWRWWKEQRPSTRAAFRALVQEGRVEFAGGGWVQGDEATTDYLMILDHFTWGLRKMNDTLGPCGKPKAAWQIDTYGHTREHASLLAQMGYDGLFIGRVNYKDRESMLAEERMEFMWRGSDTLGKMSDIMTHTLYNLYNAPDGFCFDFLCNEEPIIDDPDSKVYNADKRVNDFIAQIEMQAKYYEHDNIMVTMGGDFTYQSAAHWFMNMDKLINHVNTHPANMSDINIFYSTPSCYLKALYLNGRRDKAIYAEKGEHLPYGSDASTYWTGFYTSRPGLKYFAKKMHIFLQVAKQLTVIARMGDSYELHLLRHAMGVVMHHDAITGTSQQHVANDFVKILYEAFDACSKKVSSLLSYLTPTWGSSRRSKSNLQFITCHQTNISQCAFSESLESVLLLVYNPQSVKTYHYVRLPAIALHYVIRNAYDEELDYQLSPLTTAVANLPGRTSNTRHELVFEAENVPPLGYSTFYITAIKDPLGDLDYLKNKKLGPDTEAITQITNEYLKISVNKNTGLLESIQHISGLKLQLTQNFYYYSQTRGSLQSGAYSFRPDSPPILVAEKVAYSTNRGLLVKEIHQRFSSWVTQTLRLYRGEEYLEMDWVIGPVPMGTDLGKEVVSIFKSNISNHGEFFTDSNMRQMMRRSCWNETDGRGVKKPVAACYYPITSQICIQSANSSDISGMCVLTDRSQGGTSYNDGEIELMVHRRLLTDDGFGLDETLNEEEHDQGLIIRGQHRLFLSNNKPTGEDLPFTEHMSQAAHRWQWEPWVFAAAADKVNRRKWQSMRNKRFSALKVHGLPRHVRILTLEPWKASSVLLRLENTMEKNDRTTQKLDLAEEVPLPTHVVVELRKLFAQLRIKTVRETTLAANQWLEDARQMDWSSRYVYSGGDDGLLSEDIDYIEEDKSKNSEQAPETDEEPDTANRRVDRRSEHKRERTKRSINISENFLDNVFTDFNDDAQEITTEGYIDEVTESNVSKKYMFGDVPGLTTMKTVHLDEEREMRDLDSFEDDFSIPTRDEKKLASAAGDTRDTHEEADDGVTKSMYEMYYKKKTVVKLKKTKKKTVKQHPKWKKNFKKDFRGDEKRLTPAPANEQSKESERLPYGTRTAKVYESGEEKHSAEVEDEDDEVNMESLNKRTRRKARDYTSRRKRATARGQAREEPDFVITLRPTQIRTFIVRFETSRNNYAI